eukprot:gb/GECH01002929.1/.p1 GENE.gb/GECH01002929.1/~~gb/GECH01002929.1/.p1  ORF type:complete len:216 (+),score=56.63 gb/GECH01002929.1/:1-648(+)
MKKLMREKDSYKQVKKYKVNTKRYSLHKHSTASLGTGHSLKDSVKLPAGESKDEWFAVHVIDFYNNLSRLYQTVEEECSVDCINDVMHAGPSCNYFWKEGKNILEVSSHEYILRSFEVISQDIDNFPDDSAFPSSHLKTIKNDFKKMLRIFAHIMAQHFRVVTANGFEAHLNTSFKHFSYFVLEFKLVDKKEFNPILDWAHKHLDQDTCAKLPSS